MSSLNPPENKGQSVVHPTRKRGIRRKLGTFYSRFIFRYWRAVDSLAGANLVSWFMSPILLVDLLSRLEDFPHFIRYRSLLPKDFWKGCTPWVHYFRMTRDWDEFLVLSSFGDRLGLPYWKKRLTLRGEPLQTRPDWEKRPVILAFLHTGPYLLIRLWIRSLGIKAAAYVGTIPSVLDNEYYQKILEEADKKYDLADVPHTFRGVDELMKAVRFLKPGRVLTIALEGGYSYTNDDCREIEGIPIFLKDGVCHMAAKTNAIIIPTSIHRTESCRYELRLGKQVPDALIRTGNFGGAMDHLLTELWTDLKSNPSDLTWSALEALNPKMVKERAAWP